MYTTPTVVGDTLYVGSCSGVFFAFDARSGEVRWSYDTGADEESAQFHGNPIVTDELVVTPSDSTEEGFTYAFDRATGEPRWKQPTDGGGGIVTDLLRAGSTAIGVTRRGDLVGFGLADGFVLWSFSPAAYTYKERSPSPALAGDRVLFGGADGAVHAIDAHTGEEEWKIDLGARVSTSLLVHGEHVYFGLDDYRLVRLAIEDGAPAGDLPVDGLPVGYPIAADGTLVVLLGLMNEATDVLAVDTELIDERWKVSGEDEWTAVRPLLWGGSVLTGTEKGELSAFALDDGTVDWTLSLKGRLRGLGSAGDRLYVGTIDGILYALEETVQATESCDSITGLDPLLGPGKTVIFGELHGTVESPAFFADAVCAALAAGHDVTVGLELWREEEAYLTDYLASQGSAEDREALLSAPFWRSKSPDGRSSEAMLSLVEEVRALKAAGHSIRLVAFDLRQYSSGQERDRAMAERLREAITASPEDVHLVLTGNIHSRTKKGTRWDPDFEPMSSLLAPHVPELVTLNVSHTGGTAWLCIAGEAGCGIRKVGARVRGSEDGISVFEQPDAEGHHGYYNVGGLTGSSPAVDEEE